MDSHAEKSQDKRDQRPSDQEARDDRLREMIRHENQLRDERLKWLLTVSTFLFTALGFSWDKSTLLGFVLALAGLAFGVSTAAAMRASKIAISRLRRLASSAETADLAPGAHCEECPVPVAGLSSKYLMAALKNEDEEHLRRVGQAEGWRRTWALYMGENVSGVRRADKHLVWMYPWNLLPVVLIGAWFGILVARLLP